MPNHDSPTGSYKRRRTVSLNDEDRSVDAVPQALSITRSDDFWFDDGSIVIQAEHTQFRVHRTVLSRHSSVFRDMFSVPQPAEPESLIEGCSLVHLSDSSQDVGYLLSALYDQTYTARKILKLDVVAAMLRLGSKYDFHHLREEALLRLRSEFPSTLQEWEVLPSEYTHMQNQEGILFDIVGLALEQGIISILPVAYYLCIQDIQEVFTGQTRENGTTATLPPEIQRICLLGREKILVDQADVTLAWLNNEAVSSDCFQPAECAKICGKLISWVYKPIAEPCRSLEKWSEVPKGLLCEACTEEAETIHEPGRQKMWDMMPQNFGFPPWEELKKLDR